MDMKVASGLTVVAETVGLSRPPSSSRDGPAWQLPVDIRSVTLTSTMGPGIHVDPARTRGILDELAESSDGDSAREEATVPA